MAKKRKNQKPDDSFSYGPLHFARFGKYIFLKNISSEEEYEEMQRMMIERLPNVVQKINETISRIESLIKILPPDIVLHRAWYEMAACHLGIQSESEAREEEIISIRMLDYLQSVIVSVKPSDKPKKDVSDEEWDCLRALVQDLFRLINYDYHLGRTANKKKNDADFDFEYEEFYFKAQVYWCNVRGQQFLSHAIIHLTELLIPHSSIFNELFGITAKQFLEAIESIISSLTYGISQAYEDLRDFQNASLDALQKKHDQIGVSEDIDLPTLIAEVVRENGWEKWQSDVFGRALGFDLFDLEKTTNLPKSLLEQLSFAPGEDTDFFSEGVFKGWPLRIWPVFKRPFVKLNNHFFCFDLYSLLDGLYRVVQKKIVLLKRDYKSEWNRIQKETTEDLPFKYLKAILPEAKIYKSVYYKWYSSSKTNKDWCETDGLLVYDDCLFVIEVKAGAFTYTSPTDDFPAYIESIKNLVLKPAKQGTRFIEYLSSASKVQIYDSAHHPIGDLSQSEFSLIVNCPISLDSLTEIAAQVQHLKTLNIDVGQAPVWPLSINDLRVYADVFDNPLCFLHFCKQRLKAFKSEHIQLEDELDHLGMYLHHNDYSEYVEDLFVNTQAKQNFIGYRVEIDQYYYQKFRYPDAPSPLKQTIPHRIVELIEVLSGKEGKGRSRVSNYLLDCDGELRSEISAQIDATLNDQFCKRELIPFSTYGERKITIVCWQSELFIRNSKTALEFARSAMLVTDDDERILFELTHSIDGKITDVNWSEVRLEDIPEDEIEYLKIRSAEIKRKRLLKAGRIGRNDRCPCGSGRKYKKCCLEGRA